MDFADRQGSSISRGVFGRMSDGRTAELYTLRNRRGMEVRITNYGGIVLSLTAPDRAGQFADVVLGCENLEGYVKTSPYFGALIGRYGNRIGGATFALDGTTYVLARNNGPNSLHGGLKGFDKVLWNAETADTARGPALRLQYLSPDGEEGFPGSLSVEAVYTLTGDNELRLDFTATTDAPTICNLTQHSYFNLAGTGDVLGHEVEIRAGRFTPVDTELIPTGELKPVAGTPFDFRKPTAIGLRLPEPDPQLQFASGYDHNWIVDKAPGELALHARATEPSTGRVLEVWSTEPGIQFYSGNFLDDSVVGKDGRGYQKHSAFCLEPQHFPDSPHQPAFPSVELNPGQTYRNTIVHRFAVKK